MESVCQNYSTNKEKDFINKDLVSNMVAFYKNFLDEDEQVKYVIAGLGESLILSREQLINLIHNSKVKFEIVNCECAIGNLEGIPITIEYY